MEGCVCVHQLYGTTLGLDILLHDSPRLRVLPNLLQKKKEPTVKIIHASLLESGLVNAEFVSYSNCALPSTRLSTLCLPDVITCDQTFPGLPHCFLEATKN